MARTIEWDAPDEVGKATEKVVKITEEQTVSNVTRLSIRGLREEIRMLNEHIALLQAQKQAKQDEIAEIKAALGITET